MKKKNGKTSVTTQLQDFDDVIVGLMIKFLETNYPIKRYKIKDKFKRGVRVDGVVHQVPKSRILVVSSLYNKLETYYASEPTEIIHVLDDFYKFKD